MGIRTAVVPATLALALALASSAAYAGTYSTLAAFQTNIRANSILEPFNGPDDPALPSIAFGGNGFQATLDSEIPTFSIFRFGLGVGSASPSEGTTFTFTGRPVSAFGGTFRVINAVSASVGGTISVVTDTGESSTVAVPVAGQFFAITAARPFSSVTLNTVPPGGGRFEVIDDVYLGISGTAAEAADQCSDAPTISPFGAVQFPFTTIGTTATPIAGSCASSDTGPDVWFRFLPTVTGNVDVSTCGATFDTILRVFDTCASVTHLFCNDDACTGGVIPSNNLASRVQFRCQAGEDYFIRISGFNGASGSGNLTFSVVPDCAADFNHSGGPQSVQDIFDFLTAYFGGC